MKSLQLLLGALLVSALPVAKLGAQAAPAGPPLAEGHIKFLGGIYSTPQSPNLTAYFNQITPENASKWGSAEATRDVMNWTEVDAAYALAKQNGFPFRFHVLLWGNQQPTWIATLPAADQLAEIEEWMQAAAARYPNADYVEVVNEPISDPPDGIDTNGNAASDGNYMNALGGSGTTGWDWILTAFRMARRTFPATTKLVLNEYSITNDDAKMTRYIGIVNLLKAENLIDVVAVQAHSFSTKSYSGNLPATSAQTKANLDRLAATGVPIMVTEMDIDGGTPAAPDDATQLSEYQRIFPIFWQHPSVVGITMWGYRRQLWRDAQGAYLIRSDGTERPAMEWLRTYLTTGAPTITSNPVASQTVAAGGTVTFTVAASGTPTPALQWLRNGASVSGATSATLSLANLQPADTGLYTARALGGTAGTAAATSTPTIIGLATTAKFAGDGEVAGTDIKHPNGNVFDQVLLIGAAETITADFSPDPAANQITRTSYIDLDGDIVQVEFSGPGTLSLVLDSASGRAEAANYNQPGVRYMKGHAGIVITGATEQTNVSVFTVGRATAVNQALFKDSVTYDGIADIAFIAIASTNGKFGGVRTANTNFFADRGFTGVYAPGIEFNGPVNIGDITASGSARPVLLLGSAATTQICGGDMQQINGKPVEVSGVTALRFVNGSDSHGHTLTAQSNQAVFKQNGTNVTAQIVVNP